MWKLSSRMRKRKVPSFSCQPRVTVTSYLITWLSGTYNRYVTCVLIPIRRIWLIHMWPIDSHMIKWSVHVNGLPTIINKTWCHCHSWLAGQYDQLTYIHNKIGDSYFFVHLAHLIRYLPESSADKFCKQSRNRSGLTERWAWSGSKLILWSDSIKNMEKVDFEKKQPRRHKRGVKSLRWDFGTI